MHINPTSIGGCFPMVGHEAAESSWTPSGSRQCGKTSLPDFANRSDQPFGTDCNPSRLRSGHRAPLVDGNEQPRGFGW